MFISRRSILQQALFASVAVAVPKAFAATAPFRKPLGLQLYTVRQQITQDFEGTLAAVAAAGFREVETAGAPRVEAAAYRAALDKAGLRCVSAHHNFVELSTRLDDLIAYDKALGATFIVCSSPGQRPGGSPLKPGGLSVDDARYTAEQLNQIGDKLAAAGMRLGYHNHTPEFALDNGTVPYNELMRLTRPSAVCFELDCGWAIVAGHNPVELMRQHPGRFTMLHVKDFHLPANPSPDKREDAHVTELGHGDIDYGPILAEAQRSQKIEHAFVEQEAFTVPWRQSLATDAAYMKPWTL